MMRRENSNGMPKVVVMKKMMMIRMKRMNQIAMMKMK